MSKQRKIPLRTCVVTKEIAPKKDLVRIVATKQGVVSIDLKGKAPGRGAYLKLSKDVIMLAKKNRSLAKKLGVEIPKSIYEQLLALADDL